MHWELIMSIPSIPPSAATLKAKKSPSGKVVGVTGLDGQLTSAKFDLRPAFLSRAIGGPMTSASNVQSNTFELITSSPVPYYAFRITYHFLGGNGSPAGFKAIAAATDDLGSRDFTDVSLAAFRKCQVPKLAGTTYNSTVTDGSPGWKAVTWNGQSTVGTTDPGATAIVSLTSDIIYETGALDAVLGAYPLLIRYMYGSASWSFESQLTGQQTATNYKDDFPTMAYASLNRSGDSVATPSGWAESATPSTSSGAACITVEYFSDSEVVSVAMVGDSRFGVSSEFSATKQYRGMDHYIHNSLIALGKNPSIVRHGINGGTSLLYTTNALADYNLETPAKWLVYLIYSVNDGSPTTAVLAQAKSRASQFLEQARRKGQRVLFVTAYPSGLNGAPTYSAGTVTTLNALVAWANTRADIVFSPLATYGNADGSYGLAYGYNTDHMLDSAYQTMATALATLIVNF